MFEFEFVFESEFVSEFVFMFEFVFGFVFGFLCACACACIYTLLTILCFADAEAANDPQWRGLLGSAIDSSLGFGVQGLEFRV